ncbi:MAG TPA: hypothetical protein VJC10_00210 [Patescibacteria group bacterium]|nr:hypothetical protein [Patescibacteria group bacterium]
MRTEQVSARFRTLVLAGALSVVPGAASAKNVEFVSPRIQEQPAQAILPEQEPIRLLGENHVRRRNPKLSSLKPLR